MVLDNHLLWVLTTDFHPIVVIGVGLLLDVLGAIVIVLPDWPRLREWFEFGRLRRGWDLMVHEGVRPEDTGFDEVADIIVGIKDFRDDEKVEKIQAHAHVGMGGGTQAVNVYIYYDERHDDYDGAPFRAVSDAIRRKISQREAAARLIGFTLLAAGIAIQFGGVVLS